MNASVYIISDYAHFSVFELQKNKANQSQFPVAALKNTCLEGKNKDSSKNEQKNPDFSPNSAIFGLWLAAKWSRLLSLTFKNLTVAVLSLKSRPMANSILGKKKSKKHNPLKDWLSYLALRVLMVFLYLFDIETNLNTACFLGRLLWKYYHRGRKRALDNLRASFPEKSEQWIWQTGRRSFEHIAMLAIDVLFTPRLVKKHNWRDYSRYRNVERAKWLMQEGRGLLMVAAHYSNFEIIGYILGLFGFNIYSIARPLDNKFINRHLYGIRRRAGQKIIDKKGAAELMEVMTSTGATLCFIADQDAGKKGIFVDFFGRKASTYKSIGLLAITNNIPVAVGYSRRVDNRFYFEIGVNRIIFPEEWSKKDDPLEWITAEYTKAIEDFVREEPSQYWWLHRRWKHRPKSERKNLITQNLG